MIMSDRQEWEDFFKKGIDTIAGQRHEIERLTTEVRDLRKVRDLLNKCLVWPGADTPWRELADALAAVSDKRSRILERSMKKFGNAYAELADAENNDPGHD